MQELIEKAEKQPNITIGVIVSIVVVIFSVLLKLLFGGKKAVSTKLFPFCYNIILEKRNK